MTRKSILESFRMAVILFLLCNLFLIFLRLLVQTSLIIDQLLMVAVLMALLFGLQKLILSRGVQFKLKKRFFELRGSVWVLICSLSAFILFGLAGPAAIERSKSAHVVRWVGESPSGVDIETLTGKLVDKFGSYDMESVKLRFYEQESRKLFIRSGSNYSLSPIGKLVYETADIIAMVYSLPGWHNASLTGYDG